MMSELPVRYERIQRGWTILGVFAVGIAGTLIAIPFAEGIALAILIAVEAVFLIVAMLFASLTVRVDETAVSWHFGPGFWRVSVPLDDIVGTAAVRNAWWYGWGIRLTPHGWLYNVSGLDAVEIARVGGKSLRVGTDDPAGLIHAIETARAARD